jgi:hypothetical protein
MPRPAIYFAFALQAVVFALLASVLVDVAAHRRDEAFALNQLGYRGPARAAKRTGERRVVIVGGGAAFARDTPWHETLGPALAKAMNDAKRITNDPPFADVENLSEATAGAAVYVETLKAYDYLQPDVVAVYDGYDAVDSESAGRRDSRVFRLIGYLPMRYAGQKALLGPAVAPQLADETTADGEPSCAGAFALYCSAMVATVRFALSAGHSAVVVTPPYVTQRHQLQQRALAAELHRQFGTETRFRYVNVGPAIDLHDASQSIDGVHTTPQANRAVAEAVAGPVIELLERK